MNKIHHDPTAAKIVRVLAEITETARKGWRISEIEEGGLTLIELRLCRRSPDGSLTPTRHRSTVRSSSAHDIADAFVAAGPSRSTGDAR